MYVCMYPSLGTAKCEGREEHTLNKKLWSSICICIVVYEAGVRVWVWVDSTLLSSKQELHAWSFFVCVMEIYPNDSIKRPIL